MIKEAINIQGLWAVARFNVFLTQLICSTTLIFWMNIFPDYNTLTSSMTAVVQLVSSLMP